MNKRNYFWLLLFLPTLIAAQNNLIIDGTPLSTPLVDVCTSGDTTRVYYFKKHWDVVKKDGITQVKMGQPYPDKFEGHWGGIGIGLNNYFSSPFKNDLPLDADYLHLRADKSVEVALNLFWYSIGLQRQKNNIGLVTGLGLTLNNYRYNLEQTRLGRDALGKTAEIELPNGQIAKKNKMLVRTITVPLLLEFQAPDKTNHSFYVSAGVYGGLNFSSHVKVKYENNNKKDKFREDFNLNTFKYGAMVRTGFKWINLYATYDMSMLFQKRSGAPDIYPWSIGIMLASF